MAQIVKTDIVQLGLRAYGPPGLLKINQVSTWLNPNDHVWVLGMPGKGMQDL